MATFSSKSFEKKLKSLDVSQTGIQTLSLWVLHHRHHANIISATWLEQLKKTHRSDRRLGLFYLANDVVQNGKRKAKDLVIVFGKVFKEAIPLLSDAKIRNQVDRVFNIWAERAIYDAELLQILKEKLGGDVQPEKKEIEKKEKVEKPVTPRKTVPPDFKVAKLLVSIKKTTSLDHEVERKSKKLDNLKIDASSFDSVKHVKDRSSVGKFFKQFEESKVILDDYCQTLSRCETDKQHLMTLLIGGDAFYEIAQEEAKVIVNAYKTFGNRLNSMKKKLDCKIRKLQGTVDAASKDKKPAAVVEPVSDNDSSQDSQDSANNIQDMDLGSDSGDDIPVSQKYNPSTAPSLDHPDFNLGKITPEITEPTFASESPVPFLNPQTINGMSSFLDTPMQLNAAVLSTKVASNTLQISSNGLAPMNLAQTPLSENNSTGTPDGLVIAEEAGSLPTLSKRAQTPEKQPSMSHVLQTFGLLPATASSISMDLEPTHVNTYSSVVTTASTPVQDEQEKVSAELKQKTDGKPLQNLIDSLFPMLSKSLQTIKEKQQAVDESAVNMKQPSVNDAMAFALGNAGDGEVPRKKGRFVPVDADSGQVPSPVSLTNPKGLSDNQHELISIAAGITKFDENFLPVSAAASSVMPVLENLTVPQVNDPTQRRDQSGHVYPYDNEGNEEATEKRRDDRKSSRRSSSRHHSSHRDSSHSPSRRSSHRSSRDSRDDRREDRRDDRREDRHSERKRSSRRSQSPRRRRGSRARRSSSRDREREDNKRRHSPDNKKAPYYNDRRSPTPEMDSSATQQQFTPLPTQILNPIMTNPPFQMPPGSSSQAIPESNPSGQQFPGMLLNPQQAMPPTSSVDTTDNQSDVKASISINNNPQNPPDFLQVPNTLRPGSFPLNQLGATMLQPRLNLDGTGRPMLPSGFPLRSVNPLQLLQQSESQNVLHLRPVGPPGAMPLPPAGLPPPGQDGLNNEHTTDTQAENPIQKLSQQASHDGQILGLHLQQQHADSNTSNHNAQPHLNIFHELSPFIHQTFTGPGGIRLPFDGIGDNFSPRPIFRPRYGPKFAEPDPLLDQLEAQNQFETVAALPLSNAGHFVQPQNEMRFSDTRPRFRPRFKARFNPPHAPRFRPQFEHRPHFQGPRPML